MSDLIIKLKKPYTFEGETYNEINLEGLENLTGLDSIKAQRLFKQRNTGVFSPVLSIEPDYCVLVAEQATGLPVAFFESLPITYYNKVTQAVTTFLNKDLDE